MSLRRAIAGAALAAVALPGGARACELQPADWVPPSLEEQAENTFRNSDSIVYGVVLEDTKRGTVPFKVLHVYKGRLKAGARVKLRSESQGCLPHLGFDPKGSYGVVAFDDRDPVARFIHPLKLETMFQKGLIRRAASQPRAAE